MHRTLLLVTLALLTLCAWAKPDPTLGLLSGSVKLDTGEPIPLTTVTVVVDVAPNPVPYSFTTNANGEFSGAVRIGKARITAEGVTQQATISGEAGGTHVGLVVKQDGLIVKVIAGDGATVLTNLAGFAFVENTAQPVTARSLGPNKFWYQHLPPNTTGFGVRCDQHYATTQQRWTLPAKAAFHQLTLMLPRPVQLDITVRDEHGKPLPKSAISGTLESVQNITNSGIPADNNADSHQVSLKTDTAGLISVKVCPGRYTLQLHAGKQLGTPVTVQVSPDQLHFALPYTLAPGTPRTVTQVVFNAAKKPVAGAKVSAIYVQQDQVVLREAIADATGKVVWDKLPPVKVIVWGAGIPASVMRGDETTIEAPLAPVAPNLTALHSIQVKCEQLPSDATQLIAVYTSAFRERVVATPNEMLAIPLGNDVAPGSKFSLVAMTDGSLPRIVCIDDLYCPFFEDTGISPTLTIDMQDSVQLKCAFTTEDGTPISALSRFDIARVSTQQPVPAAAANAALREFGLCAPKSLGGGRYNIILPTAGQYRLLVDMYDASTAPLPQLLVTTTNGINETTIKLPSPLAKVPGGALFSWFTQRSPLTPHSLTVTANTDPTPIFGPRDNLLCAWYRAAPNRLTVLRADANGVSAQVLGLRTVMLKGADTAGKALPGAWRVHPLFPLRTQLAPAAIERPNESENMGFVVPRGGREANLWETTYLASVAGQPPFAVIPAPAGMGELTVQLPAPQSNGTTPFNAGDIRPVGFIFPPLPSGKEHTDEHENSTIYPLFDVSAAPGQPTAIPAGTLSGVKGVILLVPRQATKVTFYYPGIGVIANVPLPERPTADTTKPPVTHLPVWVDGTCLAGTILRADGTPWAKQRCVITPRALAQPYTSTGITVRTDENGAFQLKGLPAGIMDIFPNLTNEPVNNAGGWALNMPAAGLKDVALKLTRSIFRVDINAPGQSYQTAWWIPDQGTPEPLPIGMLRQVCSYRAPSVPGHVWVIAPTGASVLLRVEPPIDINRSWSASDIDARIASTSLGLYLPLNPNAPFPTRVTLIGQDRLAGVSVEFTNLRWQPFPLLGSLASQIDAVPPGRWRVRLENGTSTIERIVEVNENGGALQMTP